MVSRGGRSRGCSNCRRSKVKCDEGRPSCLRCEKRNISCDGPRNHTWVDQTDKFSSQPSSTVTTPETTRPVELSLAAFENDICLAYTRKNLLRGELIEIACNKVDHQENSSVFTSDPALALLRRAIFSLSVTFFGSHHHENRITTKGYNEYGKVLGQLNAAITLPKHQHSNETILTALTCMLFEIFLPTGPDNFLKHQRGIEALMSLRGPPTESAGDTATIFRGLRIICIVGALLESRPSIYVKPEWKHAPSPRVGELGMLQADFFAVLADCTQLMSDCDALLASDGSCASPGPILARLDETMNDLNALHSLWAKINTAQLRQLQHLSHMAKKLGIANQSSATAYTLYHTAHICILQMRDRLNPSPDNEKLRNDAATKIATCLELKGNERHEGVAESNTIGFVATRVAWQALGGFSSPEGQRLERIVRFSSNPVYIPPCDRAGLRGPLAQWVATASSSG